MATIDRRAGELDIIAVQGDFIHVAGTIVISGSDGTTSSLDLTGATLTGQARQTPGGPLLHTFVMTVVNGPLGQWTSDLFSSQSADFNVQDNVYAFEHTGALGDPTGRTFLKGELIIERDPTR